MCRSEQTIDLETIQPHLDIVTSLWKTEVHLSFISCTVWLLLNGDQNLLDLCPLPQISDSFDGSPALNLLGLINTLIKDQGERQNFFQVGVSA